MSAVDILGIILVAVLALYLFIALLKPEKFQ